MITRPRRPAAYICADRASGGPTLASRQLAVAEAACQRGWPAPAVYADTGDPSLTDDCSPALATLVSAITSGRHDAVIVSGLASISRGPAYLLPRLLHPCTEHGVRVEFLSLQGSTNGQ